MAQRRPRLFHVSEDPNIARFDPRPPPSPDAGVEGPAVWAIAESHLPNYLLPRDCPRICFRAVRGTSLADRARFMAGRRRVVAFEETWLERVRTTPLTLYEFAPESFEEALPGAGYWIAREAVTPMRTTRIDDALAALAETNVEIRVLQAFWPLSDAVAGSSLEFSIIRKRNAAPRA